MENLLERLKAAREQLNDMVQARDASISDKLQEIIDIYMGVDNGKEENKDRRD